MWFLKKFSAIIITILILITIFLIFSYNLYFKSVDDEFKEIETEFITDKTDVFYNELSGIKTIVANNEKSAYFALGYIHAKDRLFQMDIKRRLAQGRLSEVFSGKRFLNTDIFFRNLNLQEVAKKTIKNLDQNTIEILQSYSDGVNEYIRNNLQNLSSGFVINDYIPDKWTAENCIEIFKIWSLENSPGFKLDIVFTGIAVKNGIYKAFDLVNDSTIDDLSNTALSKSETIISNIKNTLKNLSQNIEDIEYFNSWKLCNLWIIKKDNVPLLVNDFHGKPSLPSDYYQIHLKYNDWNLIGITIPGYPFLINGRNNFVTWGISNANVDNLDYFIEKIIDGDYIIENNDTLKIDFIKDTIILKNDDPLVYYKTKVKNRFIFKDYPFEDNDFSSSEKKYGYNDKQSLSFSINWTGFKSYLESNSLRHISKSKNINDIEKALKNWSCPNLNLICGDHSNNIALYSIGKIPKRNKNNLLIIPAKRWDESYRWLSEGNKGINYSKINPDEKILVSANNNINKENISYYFDLPLRFNRIKELLDEYLSLEDYNYNEFDAQKMLFDNYSNYAKEFLSKYKPIFQKHLKKLNSDEKKFIKYLYSWDFINVHNKFEPALFELFIQRLILNTFQDNIKRKDLEELINYPQILYSKLLKIVNQPYSYWWDDNNTKSKEYRTLIVFKSLKEAISIGKKIFSTKDFRKWNYGKLHQLKLKHYFNIYTNYPIKKIPLNISGDFSSINKSHFNFLKNEMALAPTMRMIIDLSKNYINVSLPGGISEEPMSPFFKNQLNLWENGGYFQVSMEPDYNNLTKILSFR